MSTASVPNTFVNGTTADADEVNSNFTALVDFANESTVHADGSNAMTAALDAGSFKIVNVATGTASGDAMNVAQGDALVVDGFVTTAKLAADAVTGAKIADLAVDSEHIVAGAIDVGHMAANSVDSAQYVDGSIDAVHIATGTITATQLAADSVGSSEIAAGAVGTSEIATGGVDTAELATGAVENDKTDVSTWTALSLTGSWANYSGRQAAQYRKRFDMVDVRGDIDSGTLTAGTTVFTLPAGHRPPAGVSVPITGAGFESVTYGSPRLFINTDGTAKLYGMQTGANTDCSFVFSFSTSS